jgi:hypothetical protein
MWRWSDVDAWLEHGGDPEQVAHNDRIAAMQGAMSLTSRERELRDMYGIEPKPKK